MLSLEEVVVVGFASYRVAHMLAREDGPWDFFSTMRDRVGQRSWVGRGIHCALCIGFWVSWPVAALWLLPAGRWLVAPLAVAGFGLFIHGMIHNEP